MSVAYKSVVISSMSLRLIELNKNKPELIDEASELLLERINCRHGWRKGMCGK